MKKTWSNSIFTKLVITFLIIVAPFYFLGIQIFNWSKNMMSEQLFGTIQSRVLFDINNFDEEIKRIKKLQVDCIYDEDLNDLTMAAHLMNNFEKTKAINRLRNRLNTMQNSSSYIKVVRVFIFPLNLTINSGGTEAGSIDELPGDIDNIIDKIALEPQSQILIWNHRILLNVFFPALDNTESKPSFAIQVELSEEALRNVFLKSDVDLGAKSMFEMSSQNFVISSGNNENELNDFRAFIGQLYKDKKMDALPTKIGEKKYLLVYVYSEYSNAVITRYIPEETVFEPLNKFKGWYWSFSILAIIIIIFYSFFTYRFIRKPLAILVKSFSKLKQGDFNINIHYGFKDEFSYLYGSFNEMVKNVKTLIDQVYRQKILMQKAELKQLQAQVNPHFLYNSFFILQRRIKKAEYENAITFCENLGTYFKFITRSSCDEVTLINEIEHARIYAEIQATRFSNRIKVDFGILPLEFENKMVPRLIIQPIIENSFKYGLEDKASDGLLQVSFEKQEECLVICVEDNGEMLKDSGLENLKKDLASGNDNIENTGIINIHKRIRLELGGNSGITVSRGQWNGLKVEIKLESKERLIC